MITTLHQGVGSLLLYTMNKKRVLWMTGHEEMVALLLGQGASINAQTDETQETALTLACCGGFLEVADFLIKAGADVELGASTPLMEASQEGHLELVR